MPNLRRYELASAEGMEPIVGQESTADEFVGDKACVSCHTALNQVTAASTGEEGLEALKTADYDLVITDLRMPGMDGISVLREVRKLSPQTLVIMITAHASVETAVAALREGAHDYMLKPLAYDDVIAKVSRLLKHKELAWQIQHLRREVLGSTLAYWNERLPRLLLAATASGERFDSVFGEVYRFFAAEPYRARFIAREALDRPAEAKKLVRNILPVLDAIAGYIRVGQAHGRHYEDADADAYLVHILSLVIMAAAASDVTTAVLGSGSAARTCLITSSGLALGVPLMAM